MLSTQQGSLFGANDHLLRAKSQFLSRDYVNCLTSLKIAMDILIQQNNENINWRWEITHLQAVCHAEMGDFDEAIAESKKVTYYRADSPEIIKLADSLLCVNMFPALDYMLKVECEEPLREALKNAVLMRKKQDLSLFNSVMYTFYLHLLSQRETLFGADDIIGPVILQEAKNRRIKPEFIIKMVKERDNYRKKWAYKVISDLETQSSSCEDKIEKINSYNRLGRAHADVERHEDAIICFTLALLEFSDRDSSAVPLLIQRGESYFKNNEFDKAIEDYSFILSISQIPFALKTIEYCMDARLGRSKAYIAKRDYDSANSDLIALMDFNFQQVIWLNGLFFTKHFTMHILEYVFSSHANQELVTKVITVLYKIRNTRSNFDLATIGLCNFYITLCSSKDYYFKNDEDIHKIILEQAESHGYEQYAAWKLDVEHSLSLTVNKAPSLSQVLIFKQLEINKSALRDPTVAIQQQVEPPAQKSEMQMLMQQVIEDNVSNHVARENELTVDMLVSDEEIPSGVLAVEDLPRQQEEEKSAFEFMNSSRW
jgi:tetratricopeptide (TPR) repeat protein